MPLLTSFGWSTNDYTDEAQRDIVICKKILLDAGADANLCNSQADEACEYSAITKAVKELHLVSLALIGTIINTSFFNNFYLGYATGIIRSWSTIG